MDQDHERHRSESDLTRHDRERATAHARGRGPHDHDAAWPKDDRRSSSRLASPRIVRSGEYLTTEERSSTGPLG